MDDLGDDVESESELDVLDRLREAGHLALLGRRLVEALHSGDHVFLQENSRNMEVSKDGIAYRFSGERVEYRFPNDDRGGRSAESTLCQQEEQ